MYSKFWNRRSIQGRNLLSYIDHLWELDDNEFSQDLSKNLDIFSKMFEDHLTPDEIVNMLFLLFRISKLELDDNDLKFHLLTKTLSNFSWHLSNFVILFPISMERSFSQFSEFRRDPEKFWLSLFETYNEIMKFDEPLLKKFIANIYFSCRNLFEDKDNLKKCHVPATSADFIERVAVYLNMGEIKTKRISPLHEELENCHYNQTSNIKTISDFSNLKEFFKYKYHHVRGAFIEKLSGSIKELRDDFEKDQEEYNRDFRIFTNCVFVKNVPPQLILQIGEAKQTYFKNDDFMSGRLLCFSDDNYRSYFCGITCQHLQEYNQLKVVLVHNLPIDFQAKSYIMSEYKREFFKATESILKSIQISLFDVMPFEKYMFGKNALTNVKYLNENAEYNFNGMKFKPLDLEEWPDKEHFDLDEDQYKVLQNIINYELAVLSGCSGTGKTRVLLKTIELLLNNEKVWRMSKDDGPILILAFTNNSLDNLLEKIIAFTESITRIGSQTHNEVMKKYMLPKLNLPSVVTQLFNLNRSVHFEIKRCNDNMETAQSSSEIKKLKARIILLEEKNEILSEFLNELKQINMVKLIKRHKVVGLTLSAAADKKTLINALNPSIVIVEEAPNIEDYYLLGTIPESCKHLILIGDTNVYNNQKSMFNISGDKNNIVDILSKHNYPINYLTRQYRMKTEISFLPKLLFYQDMIDDQSVSKIAEMNKGLPKSLFFINHFKKSQNVDDDSRKSVISFEFNYLVEFIKYLVQQQGICTEKITVLSMNKQHNLEFENMKEINPLFANINYGSINKFQSLENDIVLLSLVGTEIGDNFFSMEKQIAVGITRAKCALYMIGNMEELCDMHPLWKSFRNILEEKNCIGDALPISCILHEKKQCALVGTPEDFSKYETFLNCQLENLSI